MTMAATDECISACFYTYFIIHVLFTVFKLNVYVYFLIIFLALIFMQLRFIIRSFYCA